MAKKYFFIFIIFVFLVGSFVYIAAPDCGELCRKLKGNKISKALEGQKGNYGVSASNEIAVEVGMDILEKGGNAVDAAVAISYALGVVEPYGSGIGGGGGMLIVPANDDKKPTFIDYRETSSLSSKNAKGLVGTPGFVLGMETANKRYGNLEMGELLEPSIQLAEEGFSVSQDLTDRLKGAKFRLNTNEMALFFPGGKPIEAGKVLIQSDLAETLEKIKNGGSDVFYQNEIAESIVKKSETLTLKDLAKYEVFEKEPVYGDFLGYEVISAPPSFSGITLIQSLKMVEQLGFHHVSDLSSEYVHLTGEVINRAYADRAKYVGDPNFNDYNTEKLTEEDHIQSLIEDISANKRTFDQEPNVDEEHTSTTHFVVMDKEGTMVSVTNTLSNFFGTGQYVDGFFLNNSLINFNQIKGSVNEYEPGKRSRTFTAPTVLRNEEALIGIGTPGGNRIPMMLTEVLTRFLILDESLQHAIDLPRFTVSGNEIVTEARLSAEAENELKQMGYKISLNTTEIYYGGVQALVVDYENQQMYGAADERRNGSWQVK